MTALLTTLHVLAVIIAIGPLSTAASLFAPLTRATLADPNRDRTQLTALHRICRVYAAVAIAVPAFGLATAARMHVFDQTWLMVAIGLTIAAAAVVLLAVLPAQRRVLTALGATPSRTNGLERTSDWTASASASASTDTTPRGKRTLRSRGSRELAVSVGVFNLLWLAIAVLMVIRPDTSPASS